MDFTKPVQGYLIYFSCRNYSYGGISRHTACSHTRYKDKKMFNTRFVKDVAYKIVEALNDEFGEDNWNTCNEEQKCWLPMSRNSFYLQIPNFEKY